jgi:hypothetical protein
MSRVSKYRLFEARFKVMHGRRPTQEEMFWLYAPNRPPSPRLAEVREIKSDE